MSSTKINLLRFRKTLSPEHGLEANLSGINNGLKSRKILKSTQQITLMKFTQDTSPEY